MNAPRLSATLVGLLSGSIFAVGLALSGMTDPRRVLAFLDFFGDWDPSLAFVMLGAVGAHFSWLRWTIERGAAKVSSVGAPSRIDGPLLLGAAIFGVGWGMSGYCPGPALVAIALGRVEAGLFVLAMVGGMAAFGVVARRQTRWLSLGEPS